MIAPALLLLALTAPQPAAPLYSPLPCSQIVKQANISGQPETLDLFAALFETALDEHLRSHPQYGLQPDDIRKAEQDFNACVLPAPAASAAPIPPHSPQAKQKR